MQRGPIVQTQMQCQDARRAFPYMVAGEIPLTEWALLERHVAGCGECRAELDRLREEAAARSRAQRRQIRRRVLTAAAAIVVVAGASLYVHQYGVPEVPRPESFRFSTASPPDPPGPSVPAAPAAAKPRPAPAASTSPGDLPPASGRPPRSAPTVAPATPAPAVAPRPTVASEPPPVSTPPPAPKLAPAPATAAVPPPSAPAASGSDERMPTQAGTGRVFKAEPTAEAMPTQGPGQAPARGWP